MNILTRYILSAFITRTLMILAGLSAIFSVFDLLGNAAEVTAQADDAVAALRDYTGLRFAPLLVLCIPMSVLLGALATMANMAKAQEIIAAGGAGFTILHVARILMAGAALFALLQFFVAELAAPSATARLRLWEDSGYAGRPPAKPPAAEKIRWAKQGDTILHYQDESADGRTLRAPLLVKLREDGLIAGYVRAKEAVYHEDGIWILQDAASAEGMKGTIAVTAGLSPEDFAVSPAAMNESGFFSLWLNESAGGAMRALWIQRKIAAPLGVVLMALLAAPMGLMIARRGGMMLAGLGFVAAGFCFMVTERILFAAGESGALPAVLVAYAPLALFGSMSLWFILQKQE